MLTTEHDATTTNERGSDASLLGEVTVEVALIASVTLRISVPASDPETAQKMAQDAARQAIKSTLGVDTLAMARVLRDDLEPIAHALVVCQWIGGEEPELLVEKKPSEEAN